MNIDCDAHFTPPEIYEDSEIKKYYTLDLNGYDPNKNREQKLGVYGRDFRQKNIPVLIDYFGNEMAFEPSNFGIDIRLKTMKEAGFDRQCLIPYFNRLTAPPRAEERFVRVRNDVISTFCEKHGEFIPVADVPHKDPSAAIEEAKRCVKELGFPAVGMEGAWLAAYDGVENPESLDWWPFYEAISKLDVPIFFHGRGEGKSGIWIDNSLPASDRLGLFPRKLGDAFGVALQSQMGVFGLIYSCIFDKYPNLKFIMLGSDAGWVPGYMSAIDGMYQTHRIKVESTSNYYPLITAQKREPVKLNKKPSQYFKDNFCFALTYPGPLQTMSMVPVMVNKVGLQKNIVIGSDWPHVEGNLNLVKIIMQNNRIDEEAKLDICGRNAERLMKLKD